MATGGTRRIYEEQDPVDEYLLNQVSKWILFHRLGALARDLEISDAEISRIMIPTRSAEEQIFKVNGVVCGCSFGNTSKVTDFKFGTKFYLSRYAWSQLAQVHWTCF